MIHTKSVLGDTIRKDGQWNYFLASEPRIGYVRVTTFGEQTVSELREVLQFKDHPIDSLILDLRGNVGGLLEAAVETCDMFIDEGIIVSTRGRGQTTRRSTAHLRIARFWLPRYRWSCWLTAIRPVLRRLSPHV